MEKKKIVIDMFYRGDCSFRTEGTSFWTSDNGVFLCVRNMMGRVENWPLRQMLRFSVK